MEALTPSQVNGVWVCLVVATWPQGTNLLLVVFSFFFLSTAAVMKIKEMMRQADNPSAGIIPLPPPHLLKPNVPTQTHHPGGVCVSCPVFVPPLTHSLLVSLPTRSFLVFFLAAPLRTGQGIHWYQWCPRGVYATGQAARTRGKLQCRQVAARLGKLRNWLKEKWTSFHTSFSHWLKWLLDSYNGEWWDLCGRNESRHIFLLLISLVTEVSTFPWHYFIDFKFLEDNKVQIWYCITSVKQL